jgi:cobalt/nickel transport system permease protein
VSSIQSALDEFASLDAFSTRQTALSALDPRAKILATLGFILTVVSFDRYAIAALLPFALFPVVIAVLGEVPLRAIWTKILAAAPFAIMVGIFNPLMDYKIVLELFGISVSGGWISFASILIRFALTVGAALVLVATTGFHQICVGLARLGVPQVFTTQLLFMHRYALVLASEAGRMNLARELRGGGKSLPLAVYGPLLGHLLLRAIDRSQRVYQAMVARGFNGAMRSSRELQWRAVDSLFLAGCWTGFFCARNLDLSHLLGATLLGRFP